MKVERKTLLRDLLLVLPGVSKRETIQQSSCVVFHKNRLYSLSQEIACSLPTDLNGEINGAVQVEKLIKMLQLLPDEEVDFSQEAKSLSIKTGKRRSSFAMEAEVLLPIHEVELPKAWSPLSAGFAEAADLACKCCKTGTDFTKECVHVHKNHVEAHSLTTMVRSVLDNVVQRSVLVRGESLQKMVQLGMTKTAETDNWLHFKNPIGLRLSVRKWVMESYPQLDEFLDLRGRELVFPKGLKESVTLAQVLADEDNLHLTVSEGKMLLESRSVQGRYSEEVALKGYKGPQIRFMVPAKMLLELLEKHASAEVTKHTLRVNTDKYVWASCLEVET